MTSYDILGTRQLDVTARHSMKNCNLLLTVIYSTHVSQGNFMQNDMSFVIMPQGISNLAPRPVIQVHFVNMRPCGKVSCKMNTNLLFAELDMALQWFCCDVVAC